MQHVPLYFRFEHVVFGRGFMADIRFLGRATCTRDFGFTWMYGVNPGALAEEGETMQSAHTNFRNALVAVFFHLAEEADSFEAFRTSARSFFEATDIESVREWVEAREAVRAGQDPELDENFDLRRETEELDSGFAVVEVLPTEVVPGLNHFVPHQLTVLAA